jgi:hypothetical protein
LCEIKKRALNWVFSVFGHFCEILVDDVGSEILILCKNKAVLTFYLQENHGPLEPVILIFQKIIFKVEMWSLMLDTIIESIMKNSLLLVYYKVMIQLYKLNNDKENY